MGSFSIALAAEISFETVALYELELKFAQIFYVKFKGFYKAIFEPLITAILSFFKQEHWVTFASVLPWP